LAESIQLPARAGGFLQRGKDDLLHISFTPFLMNLQVYIWRAFKFGGINKMKISLKAALLSAFVFPGVGQFYLKRPWRGLFIMLFVFTGLGYMIRSATVAALSVLDDAVVKLQSGADSLQELSDIAGSKISNTDPYYDVVFYLIICFWIYAVIDAYRIGKKKETQDTETSPL
jgi:TM2 domain-containing membrane protein YozV